MIDYWSLSENKRGWIYCKDEYLNSEWRYDYKSFRFRWKMLNDLGLINCDETVSLKDAIVNYRFICGQHRDHLLSLDD